MEPLDILSASVDMNVRSFFSIFIFYVHKLEISEFILVQFLI